MIAYVLGNILQLESLFLLVPMVVSLIYGEPALYALSFLGTALMTFVVGFATTRREVTGRDLYAKEGFVIVALSWIMLSFFGALPFVLSGEIPSLVDAFFESVSGFTTTGATIVEDVETLPRSMLFWRNFTHWIGGMGVLVFALAVLPKTESESVHIMKAEVPGPVFGKLVSKLSSSARILYMIYVSMTLATVVLLLFGGLSLFDSVLLALGAAGTGGFSHHNGSIAIYDSFYVEMVLAVVMLLFGVNFNLYFFLLNKQVKQVLQSEELKWYLGIVAVATGVIAWNLMGVGQALGEALRASFFTVSSILTTTGYATVDYGQWPVFAQIVLLFLMFIGGMAGSTTGGIKVSRVAIMLKTALMELRRMSYPNRVLSIHFEKKPLTDRTLYSIVNYMVVYVVVYMILLFVVSVEMPSFLSAFSTVISTLNNIGLDLELIGPEFSYNVYNPLYKVFLSFVMIMGRLEIFPMLILFSPSTWRDRI